jgi:hypothetical protein
MNKEDFRRWLEERITAQNRLVLAAALIMALAAAAANYVEFFVLRFLVRTGFFGIFHHPTVASIVTVLILATMLIVTWLRMPTHLSDSVHTATVENQELPVHVAPTMGTVWTFALGSIDSDRTWLDRFLAILAMPQRLGCSSAYLFRRVQQFGMMDVDACASIMRILYRQSERVEVATIAAKLTDLNLPQVLRELSLIDGVTFLTRQGVGVSLAPRLTEELNNMDSRTTVTPA